MESKSGNKKASRGIEVKYPFKHSLPVQIRFNDIDALGHVNNSVYFPLFDLGKAKYFNTVRNEDIDWRSTNIVVANINCDFLAPVYFNENIEVRTQVAQMFDKSFKMIQILINSDTNEVKCVCVTIMVGFDVAKGVAAPLAQEWKDALNGFEGRNLEEAK